LRRIRLDALQLPAVGVRKERRRLGELQASIEEVGVLVPLVVRALAAKRGSAQRYEVIAGAGRVEALRRSGAAASTKVPCIVVAVDDAQATLMSLVENTVREDMRPFDEAEVARVLVQDYGYKQAHVAKAIGRTQGRVSHLLAVFELDAKVVEALRDGAIEMQTAEALLPLVNDKRAQRAIVTQALKQGLSASQVRALVNARVFGDAAIEPLRYVVGGAGKVSARTTRSGKVRVVLEADEPTALSKLWRSLKKRMGV
jgi:ParB/RepB/Spo0J family partition protein